MSNGKGLQTLHDYSMLRFRLSCDEAKRFIELIGQPSSDWPVELSQTIRQKRAWGDRILPTIADWVKNHS